MMMWKNGDYKRVWEEDWKEICTIDDGTLNLDQIQRELYDYSFMLDQVPTVYCEVAGLSKPNTYASAIIGEYENRINERFKNYIADFLESIEPDYSLHKDSDSNLDNWYADGIKFIIDELKEYA